MKRESRDDRQLRFVGAPYDPPPSPYADAVPIVIERYRQSAANERRARKRQDASDIRGVAPGPIEGVEASVDEAAPAPGRRRVKKVVPPPSAEDVPPVCPVSDGEPAADERWVVQRYRITGKQLYAHAASGAVRTFLGADGRGRPLTYYALEDVQIIAEPVRPGEDPSDGDPDIIKQLSLILREMRHQQSQTYTLCMGPLEKGLGLIDRMTEKMATRVTELEEGWVELMHAREELLSRQTDRDLAVKKAEQTKQQQQQMLQLAVQQIPNVVQAWGQQSDLKSFLQSLDPDEIERLRQTGPPSIRARINSLFPQHGPNGVVS